MRASNRPRARAGDQTCKLTPSSPRLPLSGRLSREPCHGRARGGGRGRGAPRQDWPRDVPFLLQNPSRRKAPRTTAIRVYIASWPVAVAYAAGAGRALHTYSAHSRRAPSCGGCASCAELSPGDGTPHDCKIPVSGQNDARKGSAAAGAAKVCRPCRCLCRGLLLQITWTLPFRTTVRQSRQIFRTEVLTFMGAAEGVPRGGRLCVGGKLVAGFRLIRVSPPPTPRAAAALRGPPRGAREGGTRHEFAAISCGRTSPRAVFLGGAAVGTMRNVPRHYSSRQRH